MAQAGRFEGTIFFTVLAGVVAGAAAGLGLLLGVVPGAANYRPAVLSTVLIPLGCLTAWLLSPSRERPTTAGLVCFSLYFVSAFAAARLGTFFSSWSYFYSVLGVQTLGGAVLALLLGFAGRARPEVEQLSEAT